MNVILELQLRNVITAVIDEKKETFYKKENLFGSGFSCIVLQRMKLFFHTGDQIMKNKGWILFQCIQFLLFLGVIIFLLLREVDGHGAIQTFEARLASMIVWGMFYFGFLIFEWVIYWIVQSIKK